MPGIIRPNNITSSAWGKMNKKQQSRASDSFKTKRRQAAVAEQKRVRVASRTQAFKPPNMTQSAFRKLSTREMKRLAERTKSRRKAAREAGKKK